MRQRSPGGQQFLQVVWSRVPPRRLARPAARDAVSPRTHVCRQPTPPRASHGLIGACGRGVGAGVRRGILLTRDKWSSPPRTVPSAGQTGTNKTGTTPGTGDTNHAHSHRLCEAYRVEQTLSTADGYVTALGDEAGRTTPDIPQSIVDELQQTFQDIERARMNLLRLDLPPEYDEADYWIQDAAVALQSRVDYAMQGISAIWYVGLTEAGEPYFAEARAQSDYFQEAFANYFDSLPD